MKSVGSDELFQEEEKEEVKADLNDVVASFMRKQTTMKAAKKKKMSTFETQCTIEMEKFTEQGA